MILTARTLALFLATVLGIGSGAWGLLAIAPSARGIGTDYGLDTNGNGAFEWLVVEANVSLPDTGTWSIYAELSAPSAPRGGACGYGWRMQPPMPALAESPSSYPIAWTNERYFFPAGAQTVRMAFAGTDIARAGVDGPYAVRASLFLGDVIILESLQPSPDRTNDFIEWNYTTKAYAASTFEQPVRPAYFTGGHTDVAVDIDADGLADFLELRADVHVNIEGRYSLNGALTAGQGTDAIVMVAYAYRDFTLSSSDTNVFLRFRGDQIRQAGVDGPWDFSLTLYGPNDITYGTVTPEPIPANGILPPWPVYYPETLCGTTSAYRAVDFDDTVELVRYTGRFEELAPDRDGDGDYDALVIRAEVEVFASAGFDLGGILRAPSASSDLAHAFGQAWLREGIQWAEFLFPGPEIYASGVDGPYTATLSITPAAWGIDPTTTYTTKAYRATDFDASSAGIGRGYWIGDLTATAEGTSVAIRVSVARGDDQLTVVYEDVLTVIVTDSSGRAVGTFKDRVYLPGGGAVQYFSYTVDNLARGTYTVTAVLGSGDPPVDSRTVDVTV